MKISLIAKMLAGTAFAVSVPTTALAQPAWTPASEILGQPVQVTTNGVADTVTLSPGGQATIRSPNGSTVVNASWTAANNQLCLTAGGPQECVPYSAPFQPGHAVTLSSSCGASQTWLAAATNPPPAPPPPPSVKGERGR